MFAEWKMNVLILPDYLTWGNEHEDASLCLRITEAKKSYSHWDISVSVNLIPQSQRKAHLSTPGWSECLDNYSNNDRYSCRNASILCTPFLGQQDFLFARITHLTNLLVIYSVRGTFPSTDCLNSPFDFACENKTKEILEIYFLIPKFLFKKKSAVGLCSSITL